AVGQVSRGPRRRPRSMTTVVSKTIAETRERIRSARSVAKSIGFVPTMGALHAGHASLIKMARDQCDFLTVSIFVNPLQFGPSEDYGRYPRSFSSDLEICRSQGVDLVIAPDVGEMYPQQQITF